jgi:hypothetical protein
MWEGASDMALIGAFLLEFTPFLLLLLLLFLPL